MVSDSDVTTGPIFDGDLATGKLFLVSVNEKDSSDPAMIGLAFALQCSVKELYPLISSTVLASDDTETFKIGTIVKEKTLHTYQFKIVTK